MPHCTSFAEGRSGALIGERGWTRRSGGRLFPDRPSLRSSWAPSFVAPPCWFREELPRYLIMQCDAPNCNALNCNAMQRSTGGVDGHVMRPVSIPCKGVESRSSHDAPRSLSNLASESAAQSIALSESSMRQCTMWDEELRTLD